MNSASDRCTWDHLQVTLESGGAGAGSVFYTLRFIDTGSVTCELVGFPGVSLLDDNGNQVVPPATRAGGKEPAVRLRSGDTVFAYLRTQNGSSCPTGNSLRVYRPGSKEYVTAQANGFSVCNGVFEVGALTHAVGG